MIKSDTTQQKTTSQPESTASHQASPETNKPVNAKPANQWPDKIFWSGVFIGGGLLLLLVNLEVLPWPDWSQFWKFWPVILIIIGVNLLAERWPIGRWLTSIGGLVILLGIVAYSIVAAEPRLYDDLRQQVGILPYIEQFDPELEGQINQQIIDQQADYSQATSRTINVDMGLGRLEVKASDSQRQVELRSRGETSETATSSRVQQQNGQVIIDLEMAKPNRSIFNIGDSRREYVVTIGQASLPTQLNLDAGAGRAILDFSKALSLSGGHWKVGAGQLEATFSQQSLPQQELKLEVGVGQMTIKLPEGIGLRINHQVGVGRLEVFGQKLERQGTFISDNVDDAEQVVTLNVEVGVGNLTIEHLQ